MKKQISLKWKIGKYLLIFAVSLLAVLWVFQVKLLEPMYEAAKIDTVKKTSNEIVSAISSDDLAEKIYSESQQNDVCVRIISSSVDVTNGNLGCALYRMDSETILEQVSLAQANNGAYLYKQTGSDQGPAKMGDFKDIIYTRVVDIDSGKDVGLIAEDGYVYLSGLQEDSKLRLQWGNNVCEITPPNQSNTDGQAVILPCKTVN